MVNADGSNTFGCAPIACANGSNYYPNPANGLCEPCRFSGAGDSSAIRVQEGVLGPEACGCNEGYFRRLLLLPLAVQGGGSVLEEVGCWPCGNLGCIPGVQRQTACSGFTSDEPTCECGLGPGMQMLQDVLMTVPFVGQPCQMVCANGYNSTTMMTTAHTGGSSDDNSNALSALLDNFGFLSLPTPVVQTTLQISAVALNTSIAQASSANEGVIVCEDGARRTVVMSPVKRLLVLCQSGHVWIVRLEDGLLGELDTSSLFEIEVKS